MIYRIQLTFWPQRDFCCRRAAACIWPAAPPETAKDSMQNGRPIPISPPAESDFQEIQDTIFTPICTQCHIGANAPQGLRLDAGNSYACW